MSKKIISIFLLLIFAFNLIPAPALTAHAETADTANICYVKQGENGNGTYDNPFGSIQEAIESFGNSNGTVYIIGTYDMSYDNFSKWNNEITICGASSDSKISLSKGCAANFKGPTIITNIGFEMGEWSHIGNIGGKLVIDGITMPSNTMIHSGVFFDGILQSSELEIKSGSAEKIYLGGAYINSSSSGIVHDNTLIVNGGAVGFVLLNSDSYQPEHLGLNIGGNVNIIINGGHIYEIAIDSKPVININGSLNIIYNNGISEVPTSIPKNNIIGGVYKIFSAEGGMVTPSENEGKFILKADENKIAFINGQYFADGIVELNEGTTYVNWADYTQYRDTVKYNEKYPLASDFPEGLIPLSEDDIINEEKVYPLNTGFDEYNEIPGDSVTNEISLSEKSHSGKFSLKINAADTEMIPLRKTEEFIVGQNNYISTNAISLKRHAIKTNIVKLYINPGENAERISFYLSSANGDDEYSLIKNDKNGDGVFELGKDFSQGKWQEITLDLLEVSPELVNSKANGLYIKANQDSEWLIDDITSDYRVIEHIGADVSQFAKDNLINTDNGLQFSKNETDSGETIYNVNSVTTTASYPINGNLSSINIKAAYGEENETDNNKANDNESDLLLSPDIADFSDTSSWNLSDDAKIENGILSFYRSEQRFNFNLPSTEYRYKLYLEAVITEYGASVEFESGYKYDMTYNSSGIYEIIVPNNIGNYFTISSSSDVAISNINFTIVRDGYFSNELLKEYKVKAVHVYNDTSLSKNGIDYTELPGFEKDYQGKNQSIGSCIFSNVIVIRVVNTGCVDGQAKLSVYTRNDYHYSFGLGYGECDYLVFNTKDSDYISSINTYGYGVSDENDGHILITSITEYEPIDNNIKCSGSLKEISFPNLTYRLNSIDSLDELSKDKIIYVSKNNIYFYDINDKSSELYRSSCSKTLLSKNNKFVYYEKGDQGYIYNSDSESESIVEQTMFDKRMIDNEGNVYYYDTDKRVFKSTGDFVSNAFDSSISSHGIYISDDCQYICTSSHTISSDKTYENTYNIYKKSELGWYFHKTINFTTSKKNSIVTMVDSSLYTSYRIINVENGTVSEYDVDGCLLDIDKSEGLFNLDSDIQPSNYYYMIYNFDTNEKNVFHTNGSRAYALISSKNMVFLSQDGKHYIYNTIANESMVKSLLSFDGGNTWLTYLDGYWKSVYSGGTPDEYTLNSYGMTAPEISSVGSDAYNLLYSEGANIYNVGITMLVTSKSDKYTPTIKSIVFDTVHEKEDDCIYSAKFKKYDKDDYSRINRLFAFGNGKSSAEGYFLLGIGKEWLYSYKSGELLKLPYIENGILSDLKANWTTLKQYGMTESEINRIPQAALTELFLDKAKPNSEFYVIYVYKTTENSTKDIDFGVKMLSNKKTYIPQTFTLTVNLTDGKTIVCDNSTITYDEVMKFIEWLNGNKNNRTTDFYILNSGVNSYLINYGNITSISFN